MTKSTSEEQTLMYSRRRSFTRNKKYDKAFLENFKVALSAGGFDKITFKLPINLVKDKNQSELTYEEFIARERNYASVILVAVSSSTGEVIKVLFVNISVKTFFMDDTFPSGHSEPSELYLQSTPDRLHGMFEFYYSFFRQLNPLAPLYEALLGLFAFIVLGAELLSLLSDRKLFIYSVYNVNNVVDVGLIVISVVLLFNLLNSQRGLYVKDKEFRPAVWFKMAIRGEYRDNPIVNLIVGALGAVIGGVILKMLGVV